MKIPKNIAAKMDPAKEFELQILARRKPLNEAMVRGDSPIQQFYNGVTVFITGGSGFIGKQLMEKLLRSCEIKRIYMLLRSKKQYTIKQRLATILADPVYDELRDMKPAFADKIVPVEGDISEIRLGLSDKDWTTLTEEVNIIFHVAATVRFDEPLKKATLTNVRSTREALTLAKQCKHFVCFNHTSTAYAHTTVKRINGDIEEKFYPSPVPPQVMIEIVETVEETRLDAITPDLIKDWPNTYTFTKSLAEELIRTTAGDLPICIVKPPVVVNSQLEPSPGWIDFKTAFSSSAGGLLGVGLGIMHLFQIDREIIMSFAPVDYVNNALIAATWDTVERKKKDDIGIPIYTVSSTGCGTNWGFFGDLLRSDEFVRIVSPKTVWYCYGLETSNSFVYWLLTWILHYIPGYFVDALLDVFKLRPKGIPRLVKVYEKIYKITKSYHYFMANFFNMTDDNLKGLISRMSPQDRLIYNCDLRTIDYKELIKVMCIGMRKFIVKDGLQGSVKGYQRQKYLFKYANMVFLAAYAYLAYVVFWFIYVVFRSIVLYIFY